jgi:hypothetical protein
VEILETDIRDLPESNFGQAICWSASIFQFFVVLLKCSRQRPGYYRFVPNYFLSIVLKPFKDDKIGVFIYTMLRDFRENIAFWEVPRLRPFALLVRDQDGYGALVERY